MPDVIAFQRIKPVEMHFFLQEKHYRNERLFVKMKITGGQWLTNEEDRFCFETVFFMREVKLVNI